MHARKFWLAGLTIFFGVALFAILWRDVAPNGTLTALGDLAHEGSFVSRLSPASRLEPIHRENSEWRQKVIGEPVYFFARLPRSMETITVRVWYRETGTTDLRIGIENAPDQFGMGELRKIQQDGEWEVGETTLSLASARVANRKVRLVLSKPSLRNGSGGLVMHKIEVTFHGKPLW